MYSPPSLLTLIYVIVATSVVVIIDRLGNVEKVVADIGDRLSGSKLLSEDRRSTLMEFAPEILRYSCLFIFPSTVIVVFR